MFQRKEFSDLKESKVEIKLLSPSEIAQYQNEIENIFWLTSSKTEFNYPQDKVDFQKKYLNSYLSNDLVFVAVEKDVLGYLLCRIENCHQKFLEEYSSHLHINCHPDSQGKGVGTKLINTLKLELRERQVNGVYLITLFGHQNVSFYLNNDFQIIHPNQPEQSQTIYLGHSLNKTVFPITLWY